jgi:hypothetical protein
MTCISPVITLSLRVRYCGHSLDLRLTRGALTVSGRDGGAAPISLCVDGEISEFRSGTTRVFRTQAIRRQVR